MATKSKAPWVLAYLAVTLLPLGVIMAGPSTPERGFWIEFAVALGFVGLTMMALQSQASSTYDFSPPYCSANGLIRWWPISGKQTGCGP